MRTPPSGKRIVRAATNSRGKLTCRRLRGSVRSQAARHSPRSGAAALLMQHNAAGQRLHLRNAERLIDAANSGRAEADVENSMSAGMRCALTVPAELVDEDDRLCSRTVERFDVVEEIGSFRVDQVAVVCDGRRASHCSSQAATHSGRRPAGHFVLSTNSTRACPPGATCRPGVPARMSRHRALDGTMRDVCKHVVEFIAERAFAYMKPPLRDQLLLQRDAGGRDAVIHQVDVGVESDRPGSAVPPSPGRPAVLCQWV